MAESLSHEQQSQKSGGDGIALSSDEQRAETLIARYIEPNPASPGIAGYRLRIEEHGYPVWAIVAYMVTTSDDTQQIARDYQISRGAVEAVRAFYARHRDAMDARLAANRAY